MRDRAQYIEREFQENITTIKLSQSALREQVETLIQRMSNRGVMERDSGFRKIGGELPQASKEMEAAEAELEKARAKEALPPEQRALKFLQRAEAVFRDVQVSQGQQGGGGGGGTFPNAEDLADLFELELDKLQNQYEMVQRGQREQADNQMDETLQGVGYRMSGRKPWIEAFGGILEHLLNEAALRSASDAVRREPRDIHFLEYDAPLARRREADDRAHQRGLANAVASQYRDHFARVDLQ